MTRFNLALSAALAAAPLSAAERFVVYVSVGEQKSIAVYDLDPATGELSNRTDVRLLSGPGSLAVSPDGKTMYAALRGSKSVAALAIDPTTGRLTVGKTIPVVDNPVYLAVPAGGRHLLTAYYGAHKIAVYPLDADGTPSEKATQILDTGKNPHSIVPDSTGQFVVVPNTGEHQILQYRLDVKAGTLTPCEPAMAKTEPGSGPRHFRFHPSRPYAYAVNETNSSVTAFRFDPKAGTLSALHSVTTLPEGFEGKKNSCADIELTPDGRFLYASNRGHDSLAGYVIDAESGKLTPLGQTPTEKTPREFAIDPTGRYVLAAGQGSGKLATYTLDSTSGKLTPLKTYEVGKGPAWVHVQRLNGK